MKHQHKAKTKYHKILGIVFVAMSFIALVSVIYYYQMSHLNAWSPWIPSSHKSAYTNDQYKLIARYPQRFTLDTWGAQPNYFVKNGKTLATISIPQAYFSKTNFGSANLTFAVLENSKAADCRTYVSSAGQNKIMTKAVAIEPGTFYTDTFAGAAAGTKYSTKIYRILRDGICYEADMTVGIANIQNYDPKSGIREVVEADVWNILSAILVNIQFKN